MKENTAPQSGQIQALENALAHYGLTGYKIHPAGGKEKFFVLDENSVSLTGSWDYTRINHFIMGYGKATLNLREQVRVLREALKLWDDYHDSEMSEAEAYILWKTKAALTHPNPLPQKEGQERAENCL